MAERSHVKQLLMRRRRQLTAQHSSAAESASAPTGERAIPSIRRLFAQQQFRKAVAELETAQGADPDSQLLKVYALYAELRAHNTLEPDALAELKNLARDYLTDDVHGAFVHLVFGHIMLFLKKEDAAERYFQKALDMDKGSKDAERHLNLLQVRRKVASKGGNSGTTKIFGIEISPAASDNGPTKVFGIEIGGKKKD